MAYIMCVRNIRQGAFGNEPGATHYLDVPGSQSPNPSHKITKSAWLAAIQRDACIDNGAANPEGDIVFFVHGYNNTPDEVATRHRKIETGLKKHGFRGVVVSFDWPSAGSALNYLEDRHDAKKTVLRLVSEGISALAARQRPDCRIHQHILAHSMGCYVAREAFDDADDTASIAQTNWNVSQVLFVAADVSSNSMEDGSAKSSSLYRHCVRLTNYYNPFDDVLTLSNVKRIGVSPRAGRIGLPDDIPRKAVNLFCGKYYQDHVQNSGSDLSLPHIWYFDDDAFFRDAAFTLSGKIDRSMIPGRAPTSQGNLALLKDA